MRDRGAGDEQSREPSLKCLGLYEISSGELDPRSCLTLRNCLKVPSSRPKLTAANKNASNLGVHHATCSRLPRGQRPDLSESSPLPLLGQITPLPQLLRTPSHGDMSDAVGEVDDSPGTRGMWNKDSVPPPPCGVTPISSQSRRHRASPQASRSTLQLSLSPHQASGLREVLGNLAASCSPLSAHLLP